MIDSTIVAKIQEIADQIKAQQTTINSTRAEVIRLAVDLGIPTKDVALIFELSAARISQLAPRR